MAIFQLCVPVPGSWYYTFWQGLYWDTLMEVSNWSFLLHLSFSCHDEFKYLLWKSTYLFIYLAWRQNYRYLDTHKLLIWYWFFFFFFILLTLNTKLGCPYLAGRCHVTVDTWEPSHTLAYTCTSNPCCERMENGWKEIKHVVVLATGKKHLSLKLQQDALFVTRKCHTAATRSLLYWRTTHPESHKD